MQKCHFLVQDLSRTESIALLAVPPPRCAAPASLGEAARAVSWQGERDPGIRGGGEKQERCVRAAGARAGAGGAPHSSHGQRGAHLLRSSAASRARAAPLQVGHKDALHRTWPCFALQQGHSELSGQLLFQRGGTSWEGEAGLLLSHQAGMWGCERGRMSIISLHSQEANENCFENVPCT